jgi:ketosteroid isomerase-like protein
MAEDVVFLVSGQPPMTGKSAFAEGFKAAVARLRIETTSHIQEICVSGELAYCWSRLAVVMTPHAGGASFAVLETSCRSLKSYPAASGSSSAMRTC